MNTTTEAIRVRVDPTNPGQFFACCGLLELADRLWEDAEGWFEGGMFCIKTEEPGASLSNLLNAARTIRIAGDDQDSDLSGEEGDDDVNDTENNVPPIAVVSPVQIYLDWWADKSLKPWAGSMDERKIFVAMCRNIDTQRNDPFRQQNVVFDAPATTVVGTGNKRKGKPQKREPFYFDARRGASALSIDVGFSTDSLNMPSVAYPVVEAFSIIGLQRCRPMPTDKPRVFDYFTWSVPLPITIVPAAVTGQLGKGTGFRFENAFRTDQRKHKAFNPATPIKRRLS